MSLFKVTKDKKSLYIKDIDYANTALTFTEDTSEAYQRDSGYYANAEFDFIKRYFTEKYPEIKTLQIY